MKRWKEIIDNTLWLHKEKPYSVCQQDKSIGNKWLVMECSGTCDPVVIASYDNLDELWLEWSHA